MRRGSGIIGRAFAALGLLSGAASAQWNAPLLVNDPSETKAKTGKVAAARNGGFHIVYGASTLRYKRYSAGGLLPAKTLFAPMNFNHYVTESLSGAVHVVYEDWSIDGSPEVGWVRSTDDGATFSAGVKISASGGHAKHPHIAPFGSGNSAESLMSYYRTNTKVIASSRHNGSSWLAEASIGSTSESEYDCFGMAWSPVNGSVWRGFSPSETVSKMRNYTGSWGPEIALPVSGWVVRQHMAVNASGQLMILWDDTVSIFSVLYTPGSGFGSVQNLGAAGYSGAVDVCALPGTNDFYMAWGKGQNRIVGRRWLNGAWQAEEQISAGMAPALSLSPCLAAEANGTLMCVWEYWGSGEAQVHYAVRPAVPEITLAPTTLARTVYIGNNLSNDTLTVTNSGAGVLNYSAGEGVNWLSLANAGGSLSSGQNGSVTLHYAVQALTAGTHHATLTVTAPGASNTPRTVSVAITVETVRPDFDDDGDVDQSDFGRFQACLSGSSVPQLDSNCQEMRLDADSDVDAEDLIVFRNCFQGPNVLPDAACAG